MRALSPQPWMTRMSALELEKHGGTQVCVLDTPGICIILLDPFSVHNQLMIQHMPHLTLHAFVEACLVPE